MSGFTSPKLYFDPGYDIIDADIAYNKLDDQYVMIYKTESGAHHLRQATAKTLVPSGDKTTGVCQWEIDPNFDFSDNGQAVEAPSLFRPIGSKTWKLAYMNYGGGGYRMVSLDEHCKNPQDKENIQGNVKAQHGSFLTLTEREYNHLLTWEKVVNLLNEAKKLQSVVSVPALDEAIRKGEETLTTSGTFDEEVEAMQSAEQALQTALADYEETLRQMAEEGKVSDMTFLLQNPDFTNGGEGWSGTSFTAASNGVAEHYNKTFDFYQTLSHLPNGRYRVEVQSFYRAGSSSVASAAHRAGTEQINAHLYANGVEQPVCSLYDNEQFTLSPYTYPDNVTQANQAFNTKDLYHCSLECVVTDGTLTLGIKSSNHINADWCCFDNFKLTYLDAATGIKGVEADKAQAQKAIYGLDGTRLRMVPKGKVYVTKGRKQITKK